MSFENMLPKWKKAPDYRRLSALYNGYITTDATLCQGRFDRIRPKMAE